MGQIVLVTGMSGAGRTTALKALEDLGFEAVDNLPVTLLGSCSGRATGSSATSRSVSTAGRAPSTRRSSAKQLAAAQRAPAPDPQLLFLDCEDEILRRRFTETRRRHPLGPDRPVTDGIAHERRLMAPLRERADLVIDTSQLSPADLRQLVAGHFGEARRRAGRPCR